MPSSFITLPPPESKKADTWVLTFGGNTVHREVDRLGGEFELELADIKDTDPDAAHYGLVTRDAALVSPQDSNATVATVAAGSTGSVDSTQITSSKTGKLLRFEAASSVPFIVELQTVENAVATTRLIRSGHGGRDVVWRAPHKDSIQQAQNVGAGFDGFRLLFMNLDTGSGNADFHGTFFWDEI